jgi:hypothetical protein
VLNLAICRENKFGSFRHAVPAGAIPGQMETCDLVGPVKTP